MWDVRYMGMRMCVRKRAEAVHEPVCPREVLVRM